MRTRYKTLLAAVLCLCGALILPGEAFANNPGGHAVFLTWNDTDPTATFNIYRGTSTGVCGKGKIPFASNIVTLAFEDDNVTQATTYFYSVTAVPQIGGESACSAEAQAAVSNTQGTSVTNMQIRAQ